MSYDDIPSDDTTRREFTKTTLLGGLLAGMSPAAAKSRGSMAGLDEMATEDAIEEPFAPGDWLTVGPFQFQRRDLMVDWLTPLTGEQDVSGGATRPTGNEFLPSEVAAAGTAEWQEHRLPEGETTVPLDFSGAIDPSGEGDFLPLFGPGLTDNHQAWFGFGGILFTRAYALAVFERDEPGVAVVESDASQLWVNGTLLDATPAGVVLQEGTNVVLAKQTTVLGAGAVDVEFRPPEAPVEVTSIERVPQLREGEETDRPAAIRVTNTTPDPVENPTVTLEGEIIEDQTVAVDPPLAPFETRLVNTRVVTSEPVDPAADGVGTATVDAEEVSAGGMGTTVEGELLEAFDDADAVGIRDATTANVTEVVATATVGGVSHSASTNLEVRGPDEELVTTYESEIDGSVQYFGYRLPANYEEAEGPFEAVHYLHGATVDADSAAGSIAPRDDLFVVAPETRGPVAYDHEDIGRLDDNEALSVAKERFDIDENQVYVMGHSMGGHGAWHLGMTHSDRYAAAGPQHSWPDHESYVVVPYKRDRLHTHPRLWSAREISLYKNLAGPNTENAADGNLPVFVLHGGADDETPPLMVRNHLRMLANRGLDVDAQGREEYEGAGPDEVDVAYLEVPGADHWWDFDIGPGTDAVNHPSQFEWVRQNERDPYPEQLHFHTTNLAIEDSKYWVAVLLQRQAQTPTRISAWVDGGRVHVETENVARLAVDRAVVDELGVDDAVVVDGETYSLRRNAVLRGRDDLGEAPVVLDLVRGRVARQALPQGVYKTSDRYGPIRQVHYDPYRIVYGTQGTAAETEAALAAANRRSHRLVDRARAPAPVIADTAVTDDIAANYNLVLVGTPGSNAVLERVADDIPISVEDGRIELQGRQGRGSGPGGLPADRSPFGGGRVDVTSRVYHGDLGVQYVYPNPDATDRLVQVTAGTSLDGLRLNELVNWIPTHTPTPDYMVFDDDFRYQAFNACLAAGYFDIDWGFHPALGEHRHTS